MRPGRTRTGMSLYCSPYILFMHLRGTGLKTNSEQFVFVFVAGLTQVILYWFETILFSCKTEMNLRPGP